MLLHLDNRIRTRHDNEKQSSAKTVKRADGCFGALLVRAFPVVALLRWQNHKSGRLVGVNTGVPIQGSSVLYSLFRPEKEPEIVGDMLDI